MVLTAAMKPLKYLAQCFALSALALPVTSAHAGVWKSENQWSSAWEQKYRQWVKAEWNEKFFTRPDTPFQGLKLDCADVA